MGISLTISLGVAVVLSALVYLRMLWRSFGYILSPFNLTIFITLFDIAISPIFWFSNRSWRALGIYNATFMQPYLLECLNINFIGLLLFFIFLILFTSKDSRQRSSRGSKFLDVTFSAVTPASIRITFLLSVLCFVLICLLFNNGSFPLLNGNRSFFSETAISPIYLACSLMIRILGLQIGLCAVRTHKGWPLFIIAFVAMLLSGNRAPALTGLLVPVCIYWATLSTGKQALGRIAKMGLGKIVPIIASALIVGLSISLYRNGIDQLSKSDIFDELLYGNTFSDFRDGALLVRQFNSVLGGLHVNGLTYLSGLLSFIPSSLSPFREEWSWGRFTTHTLNGWTGEHFGLRGGQYMEPFINFGIIGVIIFAIIGAYIFYRMDSAMRNCMYDEKNFTIGKSPRFLSVQFFSTVFSNALVVTSSFFNIYVFIAMLFFMQVLSLPAVVKGSRNRRMESNTALEISAPK